jgi:cytochrome d ubiquinol oxidase subunit I
MSKACLSSGNKTISDVALALGLDKNALLGLASQLGVQVEEGNLDEVLSTRVADICLTDLEEAKSRMSIVQYSYYTKITAAIIALIAVGLIALHDKLPLIRSKLRIDARMTLALSIVFMVGSSLSASLGWLVREVGRKPWTVYGLLKPEELISISPLIDSKAFAAFTVIFILLVNVGGWIAMYIIAARESVLPTRVREWLGGER